MKMVSKSIQFQIGIIAVLLMAFALFVSFGPLEWDSKVSVASMIAIPAAVIAVSQLIIVNRVQRASYIKDYALRYLEDRELSETFHYLVSRYGNDDYSRFQRDPESVRNEQADMPAELRYFDPTALTGSPQERRMDNLLGFFDTLGYDYQNNLIEMSDIAGVFGLQMDHFLQREPVKKYIATIKEGWPKLTTFHTDYKVPIPFRYFSQLCRDYLDYQKQLHPKETI